MALRIDWILDNPNGRQILQALVQADNEDLFNSPTLIVIIEFLYIKYRNSAIKIQFPIYICQFVLFFVSVNYERNRTLNFANLASCMITFIQLCTNFYHNKFSMFKRIWTYIDLWYTFVLAIISIALINQARINDSNFKPLLNHYDIRVLSAFLSIRIFLKLVYFLQIID